jgi:DnaJ-domain-containing protein 1
VAIRYWKRMREEAALHADDPRPDGPNPWVGEGHGDDQPVERPLSRLGDLGGASHQYRGDNTYAAEDEAAKAARYNDWAERMRDKRTRNQAQAREIQDRAAGITRDPTYWNSDALFEESRRVDQEELLERPNPWRVTELLAVLDLRDGASATEIGDAYRRLAKTHHPDRFIEADENTREFHEQKMREVIDAYRALKTLAKTS